MPNIRNLYLSLPNLTERLCKQKTLYHAFILFFLAREHCILERMHEIIQKGMDSLTQRLDNDLKDDDSRILVPIGYIKGLLLGNMKPDELCMSFVKICELIRSQCRSNLSRNSLFLLVV